MPVLSITRFILQTMKMKEREIERDKHTASERKAIQI